MIAFYITIKRGKRTGYLAGPFARLGDAEARIGDARRAAEDVDPFTWFDFFGVTKVSGPKPQPLPPGVLNSRLGLAGQ